MANVREQVSLSRFTTLGLGGPARRFVVAGTDGEIIAAVRDADRRGEPVLVLGGGSNLVISDNGFPGTVIQVATKGIHRMTGPDEAGPDRESPDEAGPRQAEPGDPVTLAVAAGEEWDTVVASCVAADLAGLECLSGIPGLAGATPIQNVGAYGQEVADTITRVRAYDRAAGEVVDLAAADCGFGYRSSFFKRGITAPAVTGRFVVLGVTFQLTSDRLSRPVRYAELAGVLGLEAGRPGQGRPHESGRHRAAAPRWATFARPCSGCAAARAWCSTRLTRTAAAPDRSSPTLSWTPRSSRTSAGWWTSAAAPVSRSPSSRPGRAR